MLCGDDVLKYSLTFSSKKRTNCDPNSHPANRKGNYANVRRKSSVVRTSTRRSFRYNPTTKIISCDHGWIPGGSVIVRQSIYQSIRRFMVVGPKYYNRRGPENSPAIATEQGKTDIQYTGSAAQQRTK